MNESKYSLEPLAVGAIDNNDPGLRGRSILFANGPHIGIESPVTTWGTTQEQADEYARRVTVAVNNHARLVDMVARMATRLNDHNEGSALAREASTLLSELEADA